MRSVRATLVAACFLSIAPAAIADDSIIWNYEFARTPPPPPAAVSTQLIGTRMISVSADGAIVAAEVLGQVGLFDGTTLELLKTIPGGYYRTVRCVGDRVFVSRSGLVSAHSRTGETVWSQPVGRSTKMVVSPSGQYIVLLPHKAPGSILSGVDGATIGSIPVLSNATFLSDKQFVSGSNPAGSWRAFRTEDGAEQSLPALKDYRKALAPIAVDGHGSCWVERGTYHVNLLSDGLSRVVTTLPIRFGWRLFPVQGGFMWIGTDAQGEHVGRCDLRTANKLQRFEVTDVTTNGVAFSGSGEQLYTMLPEPGVHRGFRLARFELQVQPEEERGLPNGDPVFVSKKELQVGLQTYHLDKNKLSPPVNLPDLDFYSRTHVVSHDRVVDRRTLKARDTGLSNRSYLGAPGTFEFEHGLRVVDGGKYVYVVDAMERPAKIEVYSGTGRRRCTFEGTQYVRAGADGATYTIEESKPGSDETLVARAVNGKERWRVSARHVRPVDVHPKGKYVCVESGILDAKTGKWIHRWPFHQIRATPRFNARGNYAFAAITSPPAEGETTTRPRRSDQNPLEPQWWHIVDLKKKQVVAAAKLPPGASPGDLTSNGKVGVARFGSLNVLRLLERQH